MTMTQFGLPPGAYERDGKYYRTILKTGVDERGEWEAEEEREVLLPMAPDEESIVASRERAAAKGLDFYDPRPGRDPLTGATVRNPETNEPEVIGWLDRGRKREAEWSFSLGSGSTQKRRYKNAVPEQKEKVTTNGK